VAAGEFVGLWGHNGMGKSTLMRTLMGYLPATAGSIAFEGTDITRHVPYKRALLGIGYVPQGREIFPALSVIDNLRMGCVKYPGDPQPRIERVLIEFPRLKPLLDRVGGLLSGGEQQLLALARCLCGNPKIILLDEPTEGIQPSIIEEMVETLHRLRQSGGLTMILVEQNRDFIAALSQRILMMQKGMIVRETTPEGLVSADELA
jgi:branched-chain amino acid transport system ATP-binding protein